MKNISIYSILLIILFLNCENQSDKSENCITYLSTNFEETNKNYIIYNNNNSDACKITHQSNTVSRSGNYSLELSNKHLYGLTQHLKNVEKNSIIDISFWCFGDIPRIVLEEVRKNNIESTYRLNSQKVVERDSLGWKKIHLKILAASNFDYLKTYIWYPKDSTCYIDDYEFRLSSPVERTIKKSELLKIIIDSNGMQAIKTKRNLAFENGVLESSKVDYVKALIVNGQDTMKAEIRLKGDWLDHLQGDKWSFRIKLKKRYAWRGMRTFSIHTPQARSFLDQWFAHKIFQSQDVLSNRYGFINVNLNGNDLGVYAFEEHFDKHLIESNYRREGPIVKFSEDEFWFSNKMYKQTKAYYNLPFYDGCAILPFKSNKVSKKTTLLHQFENAQNLMLMYRNRNVDISYLFDIDKVAKYLALVNITKAYHGIAWHNQRFYFNPILNLLEPIAFDAYSKTTNTSENIKIIFGDLDSIQNPNRNNLIHTFFLNNEVKEKYYSYLEKYSNNNFIQNLLSENIEELNNYEELLQKEFLDYQFDPSIIAKNAERIRNELRNRKSKLINNKTKVIQDPSKSQYDTIKSVLATKHYVRAYLESSNFDNYTIKVVNNYSIDIELLGYVNDSEKTTLFKNTISVNSINKKSNSKEISIPKNAKSLLFKTDYIKDTLLLNYYKWESPKASSPRLDLLTSNKNHNISHLTKGNTVIIPSGKTTFSKPVIIPPNHKLIIKPGAQLNFINNSFLLSFSPVYAVGKANEKIKINSSDGSSMGFIVLQSKIKSRIAHVEFNQLNTLNYNGWVLTGAVTFFESDVDISNVDFSNNRCEDALNIVRSDFNLTNCKFDNIFADAFDSDFCTGKLNNTSFLDISNDAMDFSGSHILITNCIIKNTGDKGISGGENSTLDINNVTITSANIAIASKDLSIINIRNSKFIKSNYGFVAFSKKPEFGSAKIFANNVKLSEVVKYNLIEFGSILTENSDTTFGFKKDVASQFY